MKDIETDLPERAKPRSLVYFGHMPGEGTGSPVILYRHLRRFAARGWRVNVVADWGQEDAVCRGHGWPVRTLSHRRRFWPRYHPDRSVSRAIRTWLWAGEVRRWLGFRPDCVLTYLSAFSDTLSLAAVGFSRRYRVPLTTILHDDVRCFAKGNAEAERAHKRHGWVVGNSTRTLFVSPAMATCFGRQADAADVLAPIPEGWSPPAGWSAPGSGTPRVYYAGALWPAQYPLLGRMARALHGVGARLVILSEGTPELRALLEREPIEWIPPFASNADALRHLVSHASAMVVSYSEEISDMPWAATSFPSKFVEFSHLGLPCAIVAPRASAIARWAVEEGFPDLFDPVRLDAFARWAERLSNESHWKASARSLLRHAEGAFHPETIHRRLEEALACF